MSERWTWNRRKSRIRLASTACWVAYLVIVLAIIFIFLPPVISQNFVIFLGMVTVFVGPPAWIHYNWMHDPGYLLMSNGTRRVRFSRQVQAQISRRNNVDNAFGVPRLPADLRTSAKAGRSLASLPADEEIASVQSAWDDYLLISSLALFPAGNYPKNTVTTRLELGADRLVLSAGRWRPGVVLNLPYSRIVGLWRGSDIATIASGDVLVVVVDTGDDEVLFPFEVIRRTAGMSKRETVDALIRQVDARRSR